jgi:hypothetical protein
MESNRTLLNNSSQVSSCCNYGQLSGKYILLSERQSWFTVEKLIIQSFSILVKIE